MWKELSFEPRVKRGVINGRSDDDDDEDKLE